MCKCYFCQEAREDTHIPSMERESMTVMEEMAVSEFKGRYPSKSLHIDIWAGYANIPGYEIDY